MTESSYGLPRPVWQAVSVLTSFPIVTVLTAYLLTATAATGSAAVTAGAFLAFFILLPGLVAAYFWQKGWISDIEVHDRHERDHIFLVGIAFSIIGTGVLQHVGAPDPLIRLALTQMIVLAVLYPVNIVWKISVHTSSWGAMVTALYIVIGPETLLLVPFAVPMTLSRFALEAHTRSQVTAGFGLGIAAAATIFLV